MATISIYANTAFGAETFSWQDPVHSWKAGPGEVMTVKKILFLVFHEILDFQKL